MRAPGSGNSAGALVLPHIYGSAEYLNDSEAGLGVAASQDGVGAAGQAVNQARSEASLLAAEGLIGTPEPGSPYYDSADYGVGGEDNDEDNAESVVGSMMASSDVRYPVLCSVIITQYNLYNRNVRTRGLWNPMD